VRIAHAGLVLLQTDREHRRVLVVDDDEYTRQLLASALRFAGFEVDTRADGRSGLKAVAEQAPDLIVLDVMMPHLDGLEMCRRPRDAGDETPVIFLPARDGIDDKLRGLTGGGDDYVTKPFDLDELVARIDVVLKRTARIEQTRRRNEYQGIVI